LCKICHLPPHILNPTYHKDFFTNFFTNRFQFPSTSKDASECHRFTLSATEYGKTFHLYQSTGTPSYCTVSHSIVKRCLYGLSIFTPLNGFAAAISIIQGLVLYSVASSIKSDFCTLISSSRGLA
jgi:hypothetical protein